MGVPEFYQIQLHGSWPKTTELVEEQDNEHFEVEGFYTTRWVAAKGYREAFEKAKYAVRHELGSRLSATEAILASLSLENEETLQIGVWRFVRRRPGRGFTFY